MILCNTNGAHFSPRWSLVCQLRWRRCRQNIWVPSWTPHQAASSSTSPSLWPHLQTSRRMAWALQPQVWGSVYPYETPTTGNGRPVPSACLSGDTPCKWIMMITQIKLRQNISFLCYQERGMSRLGSIITSLFPVALTSWPENYCSDFFCPIKSTALLYLATMCPFLSASY